MFFATCRRYISMWTGSFIPDPETNQTTTSTNTAMTDSPLQQRPFLRLVTSAPMLDAAQASAAVKPRVPASRRTKAPSAPADDYPLRAILDIEVCWVSKRTIEQVCHLDAPDAELTREQRRERRLLGDYGLEVRQAIGALPAAIVLADKRRFRKTRPELKHLANLLEESGGVVPYTPGYPRIDKRPVTPARMSLSGTPLLAVLQAKLAPDLTVEQACHLRYYGEDESLPDRLEHFHDDVSLLREAGLDAVAVLLDMKSPGATIPEGIVLKDEKAFAATFPELAHLIPLLKEVEGVVPYTRGLPRIMKPSTTFTPIVRTHLRLVSSSRG